MRFMVEFVGTANDPRGSRNHAGEYPAVGTVLAGRYRLESLIAVGGMAAVFRATDSFLKQLVAVKVLRLKESGYSSAAAKKVLEDLRTEARASIRLSHPNIVRVYNYERDTSWEFLVMEYVRGADLGRCRKQFAGGVLPPAEIIRVGTAALNALEHARSLGVHHYDVKPGNMLVAENGVVKLCDFGLAALALLQDQPGRVCAGTPPYMSPEMIGQRPVDHRADLYSLAATLYDLAVGRPPFGRAPKEAFQGHLNAFPPDALGVPPDLRALIKRGLAKDPELRFQTAAAMLHSLSLCSGAPAAHSPVFTEARRDPVVPEPTQEDIMNMNSLSSDLVSRPAASSIEVKTASYNLAAKSWSSPVLPPLDSERTLVLAFGAPEFREQPNALVELERAYPRSIVVGCSSAGEIYGTEVFDGSLAVAVARFSKTALKLACVEIEEASESNHAGAVLARKLNHPDLRAVLVLSEGLKVNGSELVRGINANLDESVIVTGGLSGDGTRFQKTWVFAQGTLKSGLVAAIGFYGDHVVIGHGSKGGWDAFGPERRVTRSEGNVLYELDGRPALALYKEYLGEQAGGLPATGLKFPLSMRSFEGDDKRLVRTLLAVDEAKKSMTFAGDMPEGAVVQLMKANFERLVGGASDAGIVSSAMIGAASDQPVLAIAISCVGRRLVLGEQTEEEVEAVLEVLPPTTHMIGFYSYGELSPYAQGSCDLHNQTMTLTVVGESTTPLPRRPVNKDKPKPSPQRFVSGAVGPALPAMRPTAFAVETFAHDLVRNRWSCPTLPVAHDSERTLVLAFGAPEYFEQQDALIQLSRAFPKSTVVGCSSSGEIEGVEVKDRSLSVAVARFAHTTLGLGVVEVPDAKQSFAAGEALARRFARPDLRAVLILSEGLNVNGSELVRGFNSVLDESVVVTGGLSGDGTRFKRTWVFARGRVQSGVVAAIGFYGDHLVVGHGSKGGWDKFGLERKVTRSEGNVLFELDGRPALALYKEYLAEQAKNLPASGLLFPLSMRASANDEKYLVRTLLSVDEAKSSMTFAGDVPEGHLVQLMKANFDRLIGGASQAALMSKEDLSAAKGSSLLAVAISCVGRRLVLGDRVEEEVEAVLDVLPEGTSIAGFYSYGEISPYAHGKCDLHNQTMTLTVLGESAEAVPRRVVPPRKIERAPSLAGSARPSPKPASEATVSAVLEPPAAPALVPKDRVPSGALRAVANPSTLPQAAAIGALTVKANRVQNVTVLELAGRITEHFRGSLLLEHLSGTVVLDMSRVERITSFGVREWLMMLQESASRLTELYFSRCSEAVVNQAAMIRAFVGTGRIVSFFAPYRCDACGLSFPHLVDTNRDADLIRAKQAPRVACPRCEKPATFDDDPIGYFTMMAPHAGNPLPEPIQKALATLGSSPLLIESEPDRLEKMVEGNTTRIRLRGPLDASIRWKRMFDGLEGEVAIDLSLVSEIEPGAAVDLAASLEGFDASVERVSIIGAPAALVERLGLHRPPRVELVSVALPGTCEGCQAKRIAILSVDREMARLAAGEDPVVTCKRCNRHLGFAPSAALLKAFRAPQVVSTPAVVASGASPRRSSAVTVTALIAGAFVLVGVLGLVGYQTFVMREMNKEVERQVSVRPAVETPPSVQPASPAPELPPAWVERPLVVDGDTVFVVGQSGPQPNVSTALRVAQENAIDRLTVEIMRQLSGSPYYDFLRSRLSDRGEESDPATAARIASRYLEQIGDRAAPERVETWTKPEAGGGVSVASRYRISQEAFAYAVDTYKRFENVFGLHVARYFPRLEKLMPHTSELIIFHVPARGSPARQGLREGDGVVSINHRRTNSIDELTRVLKKEWSATTGGGTLTVTIEAEGKERLVSFSKPAQGEP
jgi:hypothetical protein